MAKSHLPRLQDMLQALDEVAELISGVDLPTYSADFKIRRAVERCIEIVSEASRHIPADDKAAYPGVPWRDIAGIGNTLRHEYHRVADSVVWLTATRSLPELRPAVQAMISGFGADEV